MPTIKYYVREGILPAGQLTSPNQASYDETHVRRLRLIRALLDVGGLSVAAVREVLDAIGDPSRSVHKVLGAAHDHIAPGLGDVADAARDVAERQVAELIAARGWHVDAGNPAARSLAAALAALRRVGHEEFAELSLGAYADAAETIAAADLAYVARHTAREELVESAVIGTVLGDAVLTSLRRLAQVDASSRTYGERAGS